MSSAAVAGDATPAGVERLELAVEGMTSAACATEVEKRLGEIADVATSVKPAGQACAGENAASCRG